MRTWTVKVEDENGNVVHSKEVNADGFRGSDEPDMPDVDYVLLAAAPESCPFDCDYCRS